MSPAALPNRLLVLLSAFVFAGVFIALVVFERPGLGIGHFFYVAIALLALAIGPWYGAAGGVLATGLFSLAVALNHDVPTYELFTVSTPIRLVTYVLIGALLGWFASHYKTALAELQVLAERDWLTGLPSMRGFEKAIDGRLATGKPFGLVLASVDGFEKMTAAAAPPLTMRFGTSRRHSGPLFFRKTTSPASAAPSSQSCAPPTRCWKPLAMQTGSSRRLQARPTPSRSGGPGVPPKAGMLFRSTGRPTSGSMRAACCGRLGRVRPA